MQKRTLPRYLKHIIGFYGMFVLTILFPGIVLTASLVRWIKGDL